MDKENVNIGTYGVVDPGEGPGGRGPGGPSPPLFPLFLDQAEAQRAKKKKLLETFPLLPGPPLFEGLDPLLLCLISLVHSKNQAGNQPRPHGFSIF